MVIFKPLLETPTVITLTFLAKPTPAYLIRNATQAILYIGIETQLKIRCHTSAGRSLESGIYAFGWEG